MGSWFERASAIRNLIIQTGRHIFAASLAWFVSSLTLLHRMYMVS